MYTKEVNIVYAMTKIAHTIIFNNASKIISKNISLYLLKYGYGFASVAS